MLATCLSESELDELSEFLLSDAAPETCLDLSGLDGFLAVVALTPSPILPSQWMPWVWDIENGEAAPEFADMVQAQHILGLLMRYYNHVSGAIDAGEFKPLFSARQLDDGRETSDAEAWATGFMSGVARFADSWWKSVMSGQTELVAPMVVLGTDRGRQALREAEDPEFANRAARQAVAAAVAELHARSLPLRAQAACPVPQRRAEAKVGRNDPCPCGSGKKYKKCCGGEGLH